MQDAHSIRQSLAPQYMAILPRSDDLAKNVWALENGTSRYILNSPPVEPATMWFTGLLWIIYIVCSFNFIKDIIKSVVWMPQQQGYHMCRSRTP